MPGANVWELLAALLRYPEGDSAADAARCVEALAAANPQAAERVRSFLGEIRGLSPGELQSLYTSTFDLDPVCSLEVGWHLFGENYERGEFLVKMRSELRRLGLPESSELPDHLTHALAALGRMESEEAAGFAAACLLPALDKMRAGISRQPNAYQNVLQAVMELLESRCGRFVPEPAPAEPLFRILNSGGA